MVTDILFDGKNMIELSEPHIRWGLLRLLLHSHQVCGLHGLLHFLLLVRLYEPPPSQQRLQPAAARGAATTRPCALLLVTPAPLCTPSAAPHPPPCSPPAAPSRSTGNNHGTGCTLASTIAAELAKGADVSTAVRRAKK